MNYIFLFWQKQTKKPRQVLSVFKDSSLYEAMYDMRGKSPNTL